MGTDEKQLDLLWWGEATDEPLHRLDADLFGSRGGHVLSTWVTVYAHHIGNTSRAYALEKLLF